MGMITGELNDWLGGDCEGEGFHCQHNNNNGICWDGFSCLIGIFASS